MLRPTELIQPRIKSVNVAHVNSTCPGCLGTVVSRSFRNVTSNCQRGSVCHGSVGSNRSQDVVKVASDRCGTFLAEIDVTIINPTVIHQLRTRDKHGGFRRHSRLSLLDQLVPWIPQSAAWIRIFVQMSPDHFGRLRGAGVYEPEGYSQGGEFLVKAANFGRVSIRDRAIGAHENEDRGVGAAGGKRVNSVPVKIQQAQPVCPALGFALGWGNARTSRTRDQEAGQCAEPQNPDPVHFKMNHRLLTCQPIPSTRRLLRLNSPSRKHALDRAASRSFTPGRSSWCFREGSDKCFPRAFLSEQILSYLTFVDRSEKVVL